MTSNSEILRKFTGCSCQGGAKAFAQGLGKGDLASTREESNRCQVTAAPLGEESCKSSGGKGIALSRRAKEIAKSLSEQRSSLAGFFKKKK